MKYKCHICGKIVSYGVYNFGDNKKWYHNRCLYREWKVLKKIIEGYTNDNKLTTQQN